MRIYKLLLIASSLAVVLLGCNTKSSGKKGSPVVTTTNPADGDDAVLLNRMLAAAFSEAMDPATITDTTFTLEDAGGAVPGQVDSSGAVATFNPTSNLAPSTQYTAKITRGAEDLTGHKLKKEHEWTFTTGTTTDATAPTVSSTDPINGATSVAINRKITATFSEGMDPLTITDLTFLVKGPGVTPVAGTVAYALVGNVATFTPNADLPINTLFTATITTGVEDLASIPLATNSSWTFTTGATTDTTHPTITSTNPTNGDESVALNKVIFANFSEAMDPVTINTANFTLKDSSDHTVTGTVEHDVAANVATFTPDSNLEPNTTYRATISRDATDLAGNTLAGDNTLSFKTGTGTAQTVPQDPVPLGASSAFAILASAGITNIPTSKITGDVGLTPDTGANITGFTEDVLDCPEVTGTIFTVDVAGPSCAVMNTVILNNAKTAAATAFTNANAVVRGTPASISGNLNGLTLYPGLYESGTSIEISPDGELFLDAQGDVDAVFIIRSATSITTESTSRVILTKGAQAANVYWTAGSAITLGVNSVMKGTLIASTAISLLTGANLEGRALTQEAAAEAVTLDSATITVP